MFTSQARFVLSTDLLFQEVGAETCIKYHEDFDHYKQFLLVNLESPGMVTTFKQLNCEVLGISSADSIADDNDNDNDLHNNAEEDEMMAELWKEPGLFFTGSPQHISNPRCHRKYGQCTSPITPRIRSSVPTPAFISTPH